MENSTYKEIASTLLDRELIEPDQLKKAIAAHKQAVKKGADIPFLDFLVEKGLISQHDVDEHVRPSEQDTPTLDQPVEQKVPDEEPVEKTGEENDFYDQYKERKSRSRRKTYVIVGAVLVLLGIAVVYTYMQYSQSRTARAAFEKAQNMKEQHRYQRSLDVVSNQLIDAYPSSAVASKGKTLRDNIRKILDRKKEIQSTVDELSSRKPDENASTPEEQLKYVTETVERTDDLYDKHARFLNKHFGSPSDQQADPDLLVRIDDLRQTTRERAQTLWRTVYQQKKKQVQQLIDQQKPRRAFDIAKTFQKNFDGVRESETRTLSKRANKWIKNGYHDTFRSARERVKTNQADRGLQQFREAMSAYEGFVSEERLNDDLKELQNLHSESSSKDDDPESSVVTGEGGGKERGAQADDGSISGKDDDTTSAKKESQTTDVPFNHRVLLADDGSVIEGRITRVNDQQVVVDTATGQTTTTLDQLNPASAAQALYTVGKKQNAIEYAIENQAFHAARTVLSDTQEQGELWQEASVNASNQFLNGVIKLSPEQRKKRIQAKQKKLTRQNRAEFKQDKQKTGDSPVQSVEQLVYTGDVSRRLDIVFVNDGWTADMQDKYNQLCEQLVKDVLKVKPFINYKRYINFHRVNIISEQTQIDGSTVLGTRAVGGDNTLQPDFRKAQKFGKKAPDTDLVVNVVNIEDGRATGSVGARPGVISIDRSGNLGATFVHELGHAFGNLDDEYVEESQNRSYGPDQEDEHINTTRVSNPQKVKWHYWRFPEPPQGRRVGTFEGAYYNEKGYYRPSPSCRMKSSNSRFCVVCFEQMEKSFYHRVSPLDRVQPFRKTIELFRNEQRNLAAHTIVTKTRRNQFGQLRANWYLNGQPIEETDATQLKTWVNTGDLSLSPGTHELAVHIHFRNKRVRRDHGYLSDAHVWKLKVHPYEKPDLRIGEQREAQVGSDFKLPLKLNQSARKRGLRIKPLALPPGARFDNENTRITWTPTSRQTGSHAIRVGVVHTKREDDIVLERTIRITVNQPDRGNQSPLMYTPKWLVVEEGNSLNYHINAWDPDNDMLTFQIQNRPDGMILQPNSGHLHWKVGYRHGFEKMQMKVIVSDGHQRVQRTINLIVKDRSLPSYRERSGYDAVSALRSRSARTVKQVFNNKLNNLPLMYQYLESVRLLRHRNPSIRSLAIERARTIFEHREPKMKKRYVNMLFSLVKPNMFHFTDSPEVLSFLRSMVNLAKGVQDVSSKAKTIHSRLETIRTYNDKRGVDLESSG